MANSQNKVALITGATRGIGLAVASRFAKAGYSLAIVHRSTNDYDLAIIKSMMDKYKIEIHFIKANLSNLAVIPKIISETVERFHGIDVLINNAGITHSGAFSMMNSPDYVNVININLMAPLKLSILAAPWLLASAKAQKNGSIVMVSSIAGITGKEGQVPYSVTKAGLIGATRLLARRYGKGGVRVNAVAPGFIKTDMVNVLEPRMYEHIIASSTLPRMGEPIEVAEAVYFLADPISSYINGTVLRIDGGYLR